MFSCKVCAAKESQIASLQSEISFLRTLLQPELPKESFEINPVTAEADAIISGHDRVIELAPLTGATVAEQDEEIMNERNMILSGEY